MINDPISRDKLITVAIDSKDLRILELFSKNGGKLIAPEVSKHSEFIAASYRVDLLKYFIETLKLNFKKPGRTSILQMWILKGYTFNKSSDDFIMNIQ
ncbi:hypothetical protein [Rickettsia endosymbiont of Cantharis rufa]|uniref:hypothetical protein n=1 Tax=Rickettsia endosymbiont of Cantharis rufa TaxID=3066248 RepID=UPI003132F20D